MHTKWKQIYCYIVLLICVIGFIFYGCFSLSNTYDIYVPKTFSERNMRAQYLEKINIPDFKWDAKEHKELKEFASSQYKLKHELIKYIYFLLFFSLVGSVHVYILKRDKEY
jgi:hypothetical protein